ncbi:MAG: hypothetical protein RJQ09_15830 [Cyclobacteriaceae bacterium]
MKRANFDPLLIYFIKNYSRVFGYEPLAKLIFRNVNFIAYIHFI